MMNAKCGENVTVIVCLVPVNYSYCRLWYSEVLDAKKRTKTSYQLDLPHGGQVPVM
jgi:hypothetical protein